MTIDFETLMREHDELLRLIERLDDVVQGEPAPEIAHDALDRLRGTLHDHLAKEDAAVYPKLVGGTDQAAATAARETMAEFQDLSAHWASYLSSWGGDRLLDDWDGFGEETRYMIAKLRARVRRENELLYPLALAGAHIRLRA